MPIKLVSNSIPIFRSSLPESKKTDNASSNMDKNKKENTSKIENKLDTGKILGTGLLGGGITGTSAYFLLPDKPTPEKIMGFSDDKFEKVFKNIPLNIRRSLLAIKNADKDAMTKELIYNIIGPKKEFSAGEIFSLFEREPEIFEQIDYLRDELSGSIEDNREKLRVAYIVVNGENEEQAIAAVDYMKELKSKIANLSERYDSVNKLYTNKPEEKVTLDQLLPTFKEIFNNRISEIISNPADTLKSVFDSFEIRSVKKACITGGAAAVIIGGLTAFNNKTKTTEFPKQKIDLKA